MEILFHGGKRRAQSREEKKTPGFLGRFSGLLGLISAGLALAVLAASLDRTRGAVEAVSPAGVEAGPVVALTFDDGPRRITTVALLDGLKERGVKATFFLIGEQIEDNRDVILRMEGEGHQIGIHSYTHKWLTNLNAADFADQVDRERELLGEIVGREDFLLRPPYGGVDAAVERRSGAPIILWSVDPEDWKDQNAARVAEHLIANAKDGDILLLHDIYPSSVEAALRVIDTLREKGFSFVTVSELAQRRGIKLENGRVYREFYP